MRKFYYAMDRFVADHMTSVTVLSVVLGVMFPAFFGGLTRYVAVFFACMTFCNSLGAGFREMWDVVRHPLPALVTLLILHVIMPLIALGVGLLFFPNQPGFVTGLVLEYAIPTAVLSLMWADLDRGNLSLALSIVLVDTLFAPVVLPLSLKLMVGSVVKIETLGMMKQLVLMVALPSLLAMILHEATHGKATAFLKPRISPLGKVLMVLIGVANSTGCAPFLRSMTPRLILLVVVVITLCLLGFWISYWAGRWMKLDFPTIQTMVLNGGMRNIATGAVIALQYFTPEVLFPVALSPLFLQSVASLISRVLRKTKLGQADQAAYEKQQADLSSS